MRLDEAIRVGQEFNLKSIGPGRFGSDSGCALVAASLATKTPFANPEIKGMGRLISYLALEDRWPECKHLRWSDVAEEHLSNLNYRGRVDAHGLSTVYLMNDYTDMTIGEIADEVQRQLYPETLPKSKEVKNAGQPCGQKKE